MRLLGLLTEIKGSLWSGGTAKQPHHGNSQPCTVDDLSPRSRRDGGLPLLLTFCSHSSTSHESRAIRAGSCTAGQEMQEGEAGISGEAPGIPHPTHTVKEHAGGRGWNLSETPGTPPPTSVKEYQVRRSHLQSLLSSHSALHHL